jgi:hypothetical protein
MVADQPRTGKTQGPDGSSFRCPNSATALNRSLLTGSQLADLGRARGNFCVDPLIDLGRDQGDPPVRERHPLWESVHGFEPVDLSAAQQNAALLELGKTG